VEQALATFQQPPGGLRRSDRLLLRLVACCLSVPYNTHYTDFYLNVNRFFAKKLNLFFFASPTVGNDLEMTWK
jgi:hypothetical protein